MKIHLLEALKAEKDAVLAIDDAASEKFAARAREAGREVETGRREIETLIQEKTFSLNDEAMHAFDVCWAQYRTLDESLLNLAVQNTNTKAEMLSATQSYEALGQLENRLKRIVERHPEQRRTLALSDDALIAALKIQTLHTTHIEEAGDPAMDRIERAIGAEDDTAVKALKALRRIAVPSDNQDLTEAENAYRRFMDTTQNVLTLSRLNTNVKAIELSLGKKRLIASQCEDILDGLLKAVEARGNYPLPRSKLPG